MTADRPLIVSIIGTRPEAIKMRPVILALAELSGVEQCVILTGQHPGLTPTFAFLPDNAVIELSLELREQSAGEVRDTLRYALCRKLYRLMPDLVLVQGDTTSALAGALAAKDVGAPVGHVEAGLRSGDIQQPWPEEPNRVDIDELSDLLFAPSEDAVANLAAEARVRGEVHLTGNSGIDALLHTCAALPPVRPAPDARRTILVTCHRRENRGDILADVATALRRLVKELPVEVVFPLHPNRHIRRSVVRLLTGADHITLLDPLDYEEMVARLCRCWLILTDSGGLQEEGPALGKPVLVLREVTERGEAVESENVRLVGTDPDHILDAVRALHEDAALYERMATPSFPFGDGHATPRIVAAIEAFLNRRAGASAAGLAPPAAMDHGAGHGLDPFQLAES